MVDLEQEKALIQAAQAGDREAFGSLYDAYLPGLYGYVRARMSSTLAAEDLVSDVVLSAIQKLDGFQWRYPGAFRAWLFKIARHKLADHYRRDHARTETLSEHETLPDPSPTPETQALQREMHSEVLELIAVLSPRKQEVVLLRYFGGLQNKEIAAVLDLDERTISAHLSRALSTLQKEQQQRTGDHLVFKELRYG